MIIDAHTHGFHGGHLEPLIAAGGDWIKKIMTRLMQTAKDKPHLLDIAPRLEQMERCGIDLQLVTPHHIDTNLMPGTKAEQLSLARALNDNMARLMEDSKGKLLTAGNIPLETLEQGGLQEMERAIHTLGLKAINVPSNIKGKPLDTKEYEPFWAQAEKMDIPVYVHPDNPAGHVDRSYEADYNLTLTLGWPFETMLVLSRLVFSGIMERYPSLKIVTHHLGGGIPFFLGRLSETYAPASQERLIGHRLSQSLSDYFSRFYYDTAIGGSAAAIQCAYEVFGSDHILFATDAPFGPGTGDSRLIEYPKAIKSLHLPEEANKKIFADNARLMLKLA